MIKPIGPRLIVEAPEDNETGGIVLSKANDAATPTKVVVVRTPEQCEYSPGDVLFCRRYALDKLVWNEGGEEKKIFLLDIADILAIDVL